MQQRDAGRVPDKVWALDRAVTAVAFGGDDSAIVGVVAREVVRQREIREMLWTGRYAEVAHRTALVTLERVAGRQLEVAERVGALLARPEFAKRGARLLVDVSRVGTAVLGAFRERGLYPWAAAIGVDLGDATTRVPWGEIVGVLRTEMQAHRFRVAPGLALAGPFRTRLIRELKLAIDATTAGPPDPILMAGGLPLWSITTHTRFIVA